MRSICFAALLSSCVMPRHHLIAGAVNGTLAVAGGSLVIYGGSTSETAFERPIGGGIIALAVLAQVVSMTLAPDPAPAAP